MTRPITTEQPGTEGRSPVVHNQSAPGEDGEALREAVEHLRRCVLLVPPPGAIEAAERFLAALQQPHVSKP